MMRIHPEDEQIEQYAMGSLSEDQRDSLEEHLLECENCRGRVLEAEEFVTVFRQAAQELESEPKSGATRLYFPRLTRKRIWVPAAIAAGLIVGVFVTDARKAKAPPAIVTLQALRGPESGSTMPAGRPGKLIIEIPGAPDSMYEVAVVDTAGGDVNAVQGEALHGRLSVQIPAMRKGSYWVRVYRVGNDHRQIREYRLNVN